MCLDSKRSRARKKQWLEEQPDTVVAYKIVREVGRGNDLYPLHQRAYVPFKEKVNWIKWFRIPAHTGSEDSLYIPYYHLYHTLENAKYVAGYRKVMKCHVPKKCITAIGSQDGYTVIITKKFEFIEEAI